MIQPFKKEFACMYITQTKDWKDMHQCGRVWLCVCLRGLLQSSGIRGEVSFLFTDLNIIIDNLVKIQKIIFIHYKIGRKNKA